MSSSKKGISALTYDSLKKKLGKDFVDNSLIKLLGFDNTLNSAELGRSKYKNIGTVPEIKGILSNTDQAIIFSKEKILRKGTHRFEKYFKNALNKKSTVEDVKILMEKMIDNMNKSLDKKNIEEAYFDFYFLFTFDGQLRLQYPHIENSHPEEYNVGDKTIKILPSRENTMSTKEFTEKFYNFLNNFFKKIDKSSTQEKMKVHFLSEFLRVQSGEYHGIGNSMNPMIQHLTLDEMFGKGDAQDINGLLKRLLFRGKQMIPRTSENIRKKIGVILEKIIQKYLFP